MLHALSSAHDADAADSALKGNAGVGAADGGGDGSGGYRQVVQAFFDEEADDSVGVKDEIGAGAGGVADHAGWVRL